MWEQPWNTQDKIMKVKELIKLLKTLDQEAIVDIASDEEGNSFGDIDNAIGEGTLVSGKKAYSLYPINQEMPENRYSFDDDVIDKAIASLEKESQKKLE